MTAVADGWTCRWARVRSMRDEDRRSVAEILELTRVGGPWREGPGLATPYGVDDAFYAQADLRLVVDDLSTGALVAVFFAYSLDRRSGHCHVAGSSIPNNGFAHLEGGNVFLWNLFANLGLRNVYATVPEDRLNQFRSTIGRSFTSLVKLPANGLAFDHSVVDSHVVGLTRDAFLGLRSTKRLERLLLRIQSDHETDRSGPGPI